VLVPELPQEIRELKEQVARFVEREAYPLERRIAETGEIDPADADALRRKAREAGFAMLNMPPELGGQGLSMLGQVALEEESGKATNGLGFAVVDRGPRELYELATPEQAERFVMPIVRGEYREAWALTEPGAGSDLAGLQATAVRDGDEWVLDGEKWFVTSEGEPGRLRRARRRGGRAGAVPGRARRARPRAAPDAALPARSVPRPPP
jgi:butyryl-CoA dehydrogenase